MAETPRPPADERRQLPDERRQLPDERAGRKGRAWSPRTLLASSAFHVAVMVLLIAWLLRPRPEPPVDLTEISIPITFSELPVVAPAPEPVESRVIAEADARAQSPGDAAPSAAGGAPPQPGSGEPPPAPPEPRPERPARREPARAPEPRPDRVAVLTPTPIEPEPPPEAEDSAEEKRRAVARALRSMGGSGDSWGELAMQPSSGLGTSFGGMDFQIESKSDVDWGPWGRATTDEVRRNWYSIMPVAAKVGMQGIVKVRFRVLRDGTIEDFEVLSSSGVPPLDQAVQDALLRLSSPLPPLPIPEHGVEDWIRVTYTFVYNLRDERAQRDWQRKRWLEERANTAG